MERRPRRPHARHHHRQLDGQLRELDADFEVDGIRVPFPGAFGRPEEDIHCRCALLQRARWALSEAELERLRETPEAKALAETEGFAEFKGKYLEMARSAEKDITGTPTIPPSKYLTNAKDSVTIKTDERFDLHPDKINRFLLLPGAKHSQEFFDVGYKPDDYEKLFDDIARSFDIEKAVQFRPNPKGKEGFSIFMELGVTKKRTFRTTWEWDGKGSKPRFTSAYRDDGKKRK